MENMDRGPETTPLNLIVQIVEKYLWPYVSIFYSSSFINASTYYMCISMAIFTQSLQPVILLVVFTRSVYNLLVGVYI